MSKVSDEPGSNLTNAEEDHFHLMLLGFDSRFAKMPTLEEMHAYNQKILEDNAVDPSELNDTYQMLLHRRLAEKVLKETHLRLSREEKRIIYQKLTNEEPPPQIGRGRRRDQKRDMYLALEHLYYSNKGENRIPFIKKKYKVEGKEAFYAAFNRGRKALEKAVSELRAFQDMMERPELWAGTEDKGYDCADGEGERSSILFLFGVELVSKLLKTKVNYTDKK